MSRTILEQGSLPEIDDLRYAPMGWENNRENNFLSYSMVYLHKFLSFFNPSITIEKSVILHPVIFFILGTFVFYFLIREFFDDYTALVATLILTILPSYLYRTMAGFSDKEAMGLFFMYLAFYFYIKATKEKRNIISFTYALAAGIATGFMGLGWGGFKFAILIIAAFNLVLFILEKTNKRIIINYILWTIPFTFMTSFLIAKYGGLKGLLTSSTSGFVYLVLGIFIAGYFMKDLKLLNKIKIPKNITILIILGVLGSILTFFVLGQAALYDLFLDAQGMLLRGITDSRLGLTVAENKQPFINDWIGSFGFMFLFFFIGTIILFYSLVKPIKKHTSTLTFLFLLSLLGMIFSRSSTRSILNGETTFAKIVFFGTSALFLLYALYLYFKFYIKFFWIEFFWIK